MAEYIPQSTALVVPFKLYLTDSTTPATGKTVAITISKATGGGGVPAAYANPSAGATNATELSNGTYYVSLSTTDTNTLGPLLILGTCSGCDNVDFFYRVGNVPTPLTGDAYAQLNTLIPHAFTYDGNNLPKVDVVDIAGTASAGTAGYVAPDWGHVNAPTTTVDLSGTTIKGIDSVTFPSTVASPTNITAGTITTVTNLTNAPTAGDLTATMKTSVTTAATAATPTVLLTAGTGTGQVDLAAGVLTASASGDFTATQKTSLGTAVGTAQTGDNYAKITNGTYGLSAIETLVAAIPTNPYTGTPPTVAQIATGIFQDLTSSSDFTTAGSIGKLLATFTFDGSGYVKSNAETVSDKTGYSLTQAFPSHFSSLAIDGSGDVTFNNTTIGVSGDFTSTMKTSLNAATPASIQSVTNIVSSGAITTSSGKVSEVALVDTLTTYTGNTLQTGDVGNLIPARIVMTAGKIWALDDSGNSLATSTQATNIYNIVNNGTYGNAALETLIAAIPTTNPTAAQIATAVLTTAFTEAYAAKGSPPTLAQVLLMILSRFTNQSIAADVLSMLQLDGASVWGTLDLTPPGGPYTASTRAT